MTPRFEICNTCLRTNFLPLPRDRKSIFTSPSSSETSYVCACTLYKMVGKLFDRITFPLNCHDIFETRVTTFVQVFFFWFNKNILYIILFLIIQERRSTFYLKFENILSMFQFGGELNFACFTTILSMQRLFHANRDGYQSKLIQMTILNKFFYSNHPSFFTFVLYFILEKNKCSIS